MATATRRNFADLWNAWQWRSIRNCPGRFTLAIDERRLPMSELVGGEQIQLHRVSAARDPVLIAQLSDGGVISYAHPDGTYMHTLNARAGFERKLRQLGIPSLAESASRNPGGH
jgi:hypothetical protein